MARFSAEDEEGSSSRPRKRLHLNPISPNYSPIRTMSSFAGDDDEAVILSGDDNEDEQLEDYAGEMLSEDREEEEEVDVDLEDWSARAVLEDEEEAEESDDDESEEDNDLTMSQQILNLRRRQRQRQPSPTRTESSRSSTSISITLTDPEVLDCAVCFDTLTIPVYQCENGHTACSPCCTKMAFKCPSCCLPIGYNRCRAIEKVLESATVRCSNASFGCTEIVLYSQKQVHDKDCVYAPCSCPISGCTFSSSAQQLCQHFSSEHKDRAVRFQYNTPFPAFFMSDHKFLILQEEKEEVLFLLSNSEEGVGNMIKVSCMGPSSFKGRFFYEVTAKSEETSVKIQSFAQNVLKRGDNDVPPSGFLLVPASFFGKYKQISLDVCIYRIGTYPGDFFHSAP